MSNPMSNPKAIQEQWRQRIQHLLLREYKIHTEALSPIEGTGSVSLC